MANSVAAPNDSTYRVDQFDTFISDNQFNGRVARCVATFNLPTQQTIQQLSNFRDQSFDCFENETIQFNQTADLALNESAEDVYEPDTR